MTQKDNIKLEIILELLKGENHIREISKSINQPLATTQRRINNLIEDKIIDYQIKGKNKTLFLRENILTKNYIIQSEIYKLSKFLKKHPKLKSIIEEINSTSKSQLIILFGSYAKNKEENNSDIDIYIETTSEKEKKDIEEIYSKLSIKTGKFNIHSDLGKEIIKNHIILKGFETFYEKTKIPKTS
jgi:predicted nucleotidyltransferase